MPGQEGGVLERPTACDPLARPEESRAVAELLGRARRSPAALLLEGEAGIGKTTVWLRAAEDAAAQGFRVLVARGAATEVTFAYAAVADLIRTVEDGVLAELPVRQRMGVNRLLVRDDEGGPDTDERVIGAAFVAILQRMVAEGPVLVAIDDVHWLDTASRAVLGYAAPRLSGRIALLLASRPAEDVAHDALAWMRLGDPEATARLRMRPLGPEATHALISQRLGANLPRPTLVRIHEICGGNPFFALELARAATESGPQTVPLLPENLAAVVRDRIAALPERSLEVLLAVSCVADPTAEVLAAATGRSVDEIVEILDIAAADRVLVFAGHRVGFTHPLLAHGVYTAATPAQRRRMHRRLAGIVEQSELRARHLALAAVGPDSDTLAALDNAAATLARGAPSSAAELVDLAIGLGGDTAQRRLLAAMQHYRAGDVRAALRHLSTVLDTAPAGGQRSLAMILQGALDAFSTTLPAGVQAVTRAVEEAGDDLAVQLRGLMILAPIVAATGRMADAVDHAAAAVRTAEQMGVPALHSQALALWLNIGFLHGLGVDQAAREMALQGQDPQSTASASTRADAIAALLAAWTGSLEDGRDGMRAVQRHCAEFGSEADIVWAACRSTLIDIWLGRYQDAAAAADAAAVHAEQLGGKLMLVEAMTARAAVAAYTGDFHRGHAAAHRALQCARDIGAEFLARDPLTTLAFLHVSRGEYAAAVETVGPLLSAFDPDRDTEIVVGGFLPEAVEALVALGRSAQAAPLVAALETNGARLGRAWMLAVGARGRAQILAAAGDLNGAERAARAALEHHRGLPMPFETARTQLLLGQLQRRRRQRRAAAETLTAALGTFQALGSPVWAARAHTELERLSAVSSAEGSGLTPAEARIAHLAAAGLSNREIAADLSLAPKTVEMNLSNVYRKLGIRSRAQLNGWLKQSTGGA